LSRLSRLLAILAVAAQRVVAQRWLALTTFLGTMITIAFMESIPLYADAVYYRILVGELSKRYETVGGSPTAAARLRRRPPFAFMFRYMGTLHGALEWENIEAVDRYLSTKAGGDLGLPPEIVVRHCRTKSLRLLPEQEDSIYGDTDHPLALVSLAFIDDLANHVTMIEGHFPAAVPATPDSIVEVMISKALAAELGLQVGETYALAPSTLGRSAPITPIPVRIAGVWEATDPEEDFWFYDPSALENLLFVPEATFRHRVSPNIKGEVYLGLWYLVMDGSSIHAYDVGPLLRRIGAVQQRVRVLQPQTEMDMLLVEALQRYQRTAEVLTVSFYAFSVPIVSLLLAFVGMIAGLSVEQRRNEIATLRSRGATVLQVLGIAAWIQLVSATGGYPKNTS